MKTNRKEYQRKYFDRNREASRERKEAERNRNERLRSYFYARLVLGREMPSCIVGCTAEQIEAARIAYVKVLDDMA